MNDDNRSSQAENPSLFYVESFEISHLISNRFAVSHDRKKKLAMSFLIERLIKQLVRTYFLCVVSCNLKHTHTQVC